MTGQKCSGKSIATIHARGEGVMGEREHEHLRPWIRLGSLYKPFTPWFLEVLTCTIFPGGCGRQGLVTAHVNAPDLLQIKKPLLWLLLGWLWEKSLSPEISFIPFLMLFDIYHQDNIWPTQMYKAGTFFSLCPSQHEAIYSISQMCILLQFFFLYFDARLWQTQLKFQHINHAPPHPINTDLITQLLLSQELLELCALSLQKFPLSPNLRRPTVLWSWWGVLRARPPKRRKHWELVLQKGGSTESS